MEEIIFATKNEGKLKEICHILSTFAVKGLNDIDVELNVVEDKDTFEENAIKKATEIRNILKKPVLADDSGLLIDALPNELGVRSSRFMGEDTPYIIKNKAILDRLKDVPKDRRTARFVSVIAFSADDICITARGVIEGFIHTDMAGDCGFGYDPIFYVPSYKKTMAQISLDEKNKISHRAIAMEKMAKKLEKYRGGL